MLYSMRQQREGSGELSALPSAAGCRHSLSLGSCKHLPVLICGCAPVWDGIEMLGYQGIMY